MKTKKRSGFPFSDTNKCSICSRVRLLFQWKAPNRQPSWNTEKLQLKLNAEPLFSTWEKATKLTQKVKTANKDVKSECTPAISLSFRPKQHITSPIGDKIAQANSKVINSLLINVCSLFYYFNFVQSTRTFEDVCLLWKDTASCHGFTTEELDNLVLAIPDSSDLEPYLNSTGLVPGFLLAHFLEEFLLVADKLYKFISHFDNPKSYVILHSLRLHIQELREKVDSSVNILVAASQEIINSKALRSLLLHVLAVSYTFFRLRNLIKLCNGLNAGTRFGSQAGFQLRDLLKLCTLSNPKSPVIFSVFFSSYFFRALLFYTLLFSL